MKRLLPCVFLFSVLFLSPQKGYSTTITATQSGNWSSAATWGDTAPPGCFDTIIIPAGIVVTVDIMVNLTGCPPVYINVFGEMHFQAGKKMDLPDGSVVFIQPGGTLTGGGGSGNSNWITINGDPYWTAGSGDLSGPAVLCQSCALPIELVNFKAELMYGYVNVTWQTASEIDNDYFLIQRSGDGINWESIAEVDGAGNSSVLLDYGIEDRNPLLGVSYYRLMQVDHDGDFTISDTRVISNGQFFTDQELLVFTNQSPTQQNIVIYFSEPINGEVQIFVAGVNGAIVYSQTQHLTDEKWIVITIDYALSAGVYFVKTNQKIEKVFFE